MARLKRRADFLAVAKGVRIHRPTLTLQAAARLGEVSEVSRPRVGFTVTKKVGNAVVRNRIKRRFRAASDGLEAEFAPATDYVIVARRDALTAPFDTLTGELAGALAAARAKLSRSGATRPARMAGGQPAIGARAAGEPATETQAAGGEPAVRTEAAGGEPALRNELAGGEPAVQKRA
jgi:ribonuclease P protein component